MVIELPELYPHQVDMVDRLRKSIAKHRASILQAAPGVGKTRCAKWMLGSAANREPKPDQTGKSLFAVHRRGLVDNASNSFSESPELPHGVLMSGVEHNASQAVQVASIDTLLSWFCEGGAYNWDETFDLVIFDESHAHFQKLQTFLAAHNQRRLDKGLSLPFVIGLTATPQAQGLADIYQEIVRGPETQWLIDNKFLSPFRYFRATQGKLGLLVKKGDEYTKDSVCNAMEGLSGDLVRDWKKFAEGRATVGFFPRRTHAKEAQEELCKAGVKAEYVDGETDDDRRQLLYKWLNNGDIEYLCNVGVVERGTDIPRIGCVQMCTAVGNVVRWLQMIGRGSRVHPEVPDCIAEGELVLTKRGLVAIENIAYSDRLWDGVDWVTHDGVICKGYRDVISYQGLRATEDHKVMCQGVWRSFGEVARLGLRIDQTGIGRHQLRHSYDRLDNSASPASFRSQTRVCTHHLQVRAVEVDIARQLKARCREGLSSMSTAKAIAEVALRSPKCREGSMLQCQQQQIQRLRWTRNRVSVCSYHRRCCLLSRTIGSNEGRSVRSQRQRWSLRDRQPSLDNREGEYEQSAGAAHRETASVSHVASRHQICRLDSDCVFWKGNDREGIGPSVVSGTQTARVWDIVNAGPRNRFTVSGLLASNCYVIDHGNGIERHGFFEDSIPWTLDWSERPSKDHVARPKIECPKCSAVYRGGRCSHCGYEPNKGERRSQGLEFDGSELKEVKKKERAKPGPQSCEEIMVSALYASGRSGRTWKQALAIAYSKAKQQGIQFKVPKRFEVGGRVYKPVPYGSTDGSRRVRDLYDFV